MGGRGFESHHEVLRVTNMKTSGRRSECLLGSAIANELRLTIILVQFFDELMAKIILNAFS